ncbi:DUF411 domain-containing protein [Bosea sp. (in: a-proteobacteria)]|jgi:hypothetical protein|uniref:DUF411 domain-containing protein n=1 Tax=Bosea sp. (in: a-proteobacteria) TaxID=1871050 RepID=UPI0025C23559|nr:DUF411 domain-containing protein [Bosea sp. (in: a-proteobacteria)]
MLTRRGLIAGALACSASLPLAAQGAAPVVTVYRSASCGCCGAWVDHMKKAGFETKVVMTEELAARKREFGVPDAAESCHTAMVDGYFVEGHVPAADVRRLLRERPQARGLAVPEMPVGSPGMEVPGVKADRYDTWLIAKDGSHTVFASH